MSRMPIAIVGHVDHGKSTIIGRLLADTQSLPKGKLERIKLHCDRNSKPFEYAFLLDALKEEQAQGITIDVARIFFQTSKRYYLILDAPGHLEFLKNMISGASSAHAAFLVIDAKEGVQENTRRHGFLLSLLGIRQIAVLVNKMDLVGYQQECFESIHREYSNYLSDINIHPQLFIPVSGFYGANIVQKSDAMGWYHGPTALEALDFFESSKPLAEKAFRMPVQDVYKFTKKRDDRRIVAGTVESGRLRVEDEIIFYPSGKKSRVKSFEGFNRPGLKEVSAGMATGLTLTEQIYVGRGEVAACFGEMPTKITSRLKVSLFWLGKGPMLQNKEYVFKTGTNRVSMRLEEIIRIVDAISLTHKSGHQVEKYDVVECVLKLGCSVAFDLMEDIPSMGRFVIVDGYDVVGGGIIREALEDTQSWVRENLLRRNFKWEESFVSKEERVKRYGHHAALVLITGQRTAKRKEMAKSLEKQLFQEGNSVYYLSFGNVLYGVDADIQQDTHFHAEQIRRFAEVVHILLQTGIIVVASAVELMQKDLELIRETVNGEHLITVWVGEQERMNADYDVYVSEQQGVGLHKIRDKLMETIIV